jgi:hypothetical protein
MSDRDALAFRSAAKGLRHVQLMRQVVGAPPEFLANVATSIMGWSSPFSWTGDGDAASVGAGALLFRPTAPPSEHAPTSHSGQQMSRLGRWPLTLNTRRNDAVPTVSFCINGPSQRA